MRWLSTAARESQMLPPDRSAYPSKPSENYGQFKPSDLENCMGMPFDKMAGNAVQRCHELRDLTTMQLLDRLGPMVSCRATVVGPREPYRRRSMVCLPRSSEIGPVGANDYFLPRRLPRPAGLAPIRNASRLTALILVSDQPSRCLAPPGPSLARIGRITVFRRDGAAV
jgi:hypothetical protein